MLQANTHQYNPRWNVCLQFIYAIRHYSDDMCIYSGNYNLPLKDNCIEWVWRIRTRVVWGEKEQYRQEVLICDSKSLFTVGNTMIELVRLGTAFWLYVFLLSKELSQRRKQRWTGNLSWNRKLSIFARAL